VAVAMKGAQAGAQVQACMHMCVGAGVNAQVKVYRSMQECNCICAQAFNHACRRN